jgi:hypothetical protein
MSSSLKKIPEIEVEKFCKKILSKKDEEREKKNRKKETEKEKLKVRIIVFIYLYCKIRSVVVFDIKTPNHIHPRGFKYVILNT